MVFKIIDIVKQGKKVLEVFSRDENIAPCLKNHFKFTFRLC